MLRKRSVGKHISYLCIISAFLMMGTGLMGDSLSSSGSYGSGLLISQGMKAKMNEILGVIDIADEAKGKGFNVKNIPQQQFAKFMIIAKGLKIAEIPVPLQGSTTEGLVYVNTILPLNLPKEGSVIYIWKNGKEVPVTRAGDADSEVAVQVPLDKGTNYLCFLVKNGNQWWGRSRVLKIESPGMVIEEKKEPPVPPKSTINDYWEEAKERQCANMPVKDSILGFIGFNTTAHGSIITDLPSPLSGSTAYGVIDSMLVLPRDIPGSNNSVYLWTNGEEMLIDKTGRGNESVLSKLVLANGANYICGIVRNGGKYLGRTLMVKVNSSVTSSIARFEMTWDGQGDMDLHVDSASGWHVGFANSNINQGGASANLDIDNMGGFGPENIRIFSLPSASKVRCFVNFYSGYNPLNVTVRYFDKNNKVVKSENKTFPQGSTSSTSEFNNRSWVVGEFIVTP